MHEMEKAAPGTAIPGGPKDQNIAECSKVNRLRQLMQDLPIGGLVGPVAPGDGIGDFLADARIGDVLQTILRPTPIHRLGRVDGYDLLAMHRIHSEACFSITRGFDDRFLLVTAIATGGRR